MRFTSPLLVFSWPAQPAVRVGPAYAVTLPGRPRIDAVMVPTPRKERPEEPLSARGHREGAGALEYDVAALGRTQGPLLFEAVAELDVGKVEAVEGFARSWGLLGHDLPPLSLESRPARRTPLRWWGQDLETWGVWVAELRETRELWRAISEQDEAALGQVVSIGCRGGRTVALYRGVRGGFDAPLPRRSLTDAARVVLATLVSQRVETVLAVGYDRARPRRLRLVARPRSLIAAAWAQLAEHVTRDAAKACQRCGKIFVVSLEAGGRRPEHCSDACRIAMHRRRAKAREGSK